MRWPPGTYAAVVIVLAAVVTGCSTDPGPDTTPRTTTQTPGVRAASPVPVMTPDPEASRSAAEALDAADRERIEQAQSTFDELLATAPEQRQRFLVSLVEPLAVTKFLSLPAEQLEPVEDLYGWNLPPGTTGAITGQSEVHTDDGLLRASDLRDSIIRFLEVSMQHMNGKQSRDQLRSYRQLRASLLADPDALTMSGWSCQCTPTEVVALLDALGVEATAVEATVDTGGGPIWPSTSTSDAP